MTQEVGMTLTKRTRRLSAHNLPLTRLASALGVSNEVVKKALNGKLSGVSLSTAEALHEGLRKLERAYYPWEFSGPTTGQPSPARSIEERVGQECAAELERAQRINPNFTSPLDAFCELGKRLNEFGESVLTMVAGRVDSDLVQQAAMRLAVDALRLIVQMQKTTPGGADGADSQGETVS